MEDLLGVGLAAVEAYSVRAAGACCEQVEAPAEDQTEVLVSSSVAQKVDQLEELASN